MITGQRVWEPDEIEQLFDAAPSLLDAAQRVMAAKDEVDAWMALGWPARTLVPEPNRNAAHAAFAALRAVIAKATGDAT